MLAIVLTGAAILTTAFVLPAAILATAFVLPAAVLTTAFVLPAAILATAFVLPVVLPATCMDAGAGWTPRGSPFTDAIRYGQSRRRGAAVPVPALVFCAATLVTVPVWVSPALVFCTATLVTMPA